MEMLLKLKTSESTAVIKYKRTSFFVLFFVSLCRYKV